MNPAAKYVTHTLLGPIPHLTVDSKIGLIAAPVKLITDGKRLVTSDTKGGPLGFPRIKDHCFVHAIPGGGEILGNRIGYFDELRFSKRLADLLEFWNAQPHHTGD